MKKAITLLLFLTLIAGISHPTEVSAQTAEPVTTILSVTRDADGGYTVESITEVPSGTCGVYATSTKTKTKDITHYDSSKTLCWRYSLTGTFRVNSGVSATCTDATASLSIRNKSYTLHSENHSHSGNKATGTIKIAYKGNISSNTVTITCSKNGKIS